MSVVGEIYNELYISKFRNFFENISIACCNYSKQKKQAKHFKYLKFVIRTKNHLHLVLLTLIRLLFELPEKFVNQTHRQTSL